MSWWFGRKAAPADVRPFVPAWLAAGESEGFARSYLAQFDEVYRRNPVGQRAVRLVAGMTGALSCQGRRSRRFGVQDVASKWNKALLDKAARPNGALVYEPEDRSALSDAPTGEWAEHADAIAGWTAGGWRFVAAVEGMRVALRTSGSVAAFRAGAWEIGQMRGHALMIGGTQVVGAQAPAISAPSGGTVVDMEARAALSSILAALRGHGLIAP